MVLEHAPPIDDAAKPRIERVNDGADTGEEEHGRHRKLDHVSDPGQMRFEGHVL
jgi:hypothetical protein